MCNYCDYDGSVELDSQEGQALSFLCPDHDRNFNEHIRELLGIVVGQQSEDEELDK